MQEIIAEVNGKGGSGKSPTAVHLFNALSRVRPEGKYLFLDADPQATGSFHFLGAKHKYEDLTFYEAIKDMRRIEPTQLSKQRFILSSHDGLSAAEDELTKNPAHPFQWRLKSLLQLYQDFDVVVIDTPGSHISIFTIMALTAATKVMVPVRTEIAHHQATLDTMSLIEDVRRGVLNPDLVIWGLFPNQFELNNGHCRDALALIRDIKDPDGNKYPVYPKPSLKRARYGDATAMHADVSEFRDTSYLKSYWEEVATSVLAEKMPEIAEVKS